MNAVRKLACGVACALTAFGFVRAGGLGYVEDGLMGHWDAIQNIDADLPHCADTNVWNDLSGKGGQWALVSGQYEWRDNALYCKGTAYAGKISSAQKKIVTAEICFEDDDSASSSSFHTIWAGGQGAGGSTGASAYFMALGKGTEKTITMCGKTGIAGAVVKTGVPMTVTAVYANNSSGVAQAPRLGYVDGVVSNLTTGLEYNNVGMDSCTIGGRGNATDRNFKGKIHSIRLYTRELTAEEIAHNAAIDAGRFCLSRMGFGVAPVPVQTATGHEIRPELTVTLTDGTPLVKDVDYTVAYSNNVFAGAAFAAVTPTPDRAATLPYGQKPQLVSFTIKSTFRIGADLYVQNGLANHWDAIENAGLGKSHDSAAKTWVDLCGGEGWTVNTSYGSWSDGKAFACNGNGVAGSRTAQQMGVVTADIAFRHTSGITIWMSGQRTGGYSAHWAYWSQKLTMVRGKGCTISDGVDMTLSAVYNLDGQYSASLSKVYRDGSEASAVTTEASSYNDAGGANCTLGGRGSDTSRNWKGRIYGMRFYTRELTAEEAWTNATLDAIRFFGATPLVVGDIPTQTYDGRHPCTPALYVTNRLTKSELRVDTDYRVVYRDNATSGTATAQVIGLGGYAGYVQETTFVVVSSSFTTPGELADACTVGYSASTGGSAVFNGSVSIFGDGSVHTLKLLMGTDAGALAVAATDEAVREGAFSLSAAWPAYGVPVYYKLRYETSDGEQTYVSETSVFSSSPEHVATYTWKTSVTEGNWQDAANWTVSGANVANPCGYPQFGNYHAVLFPSATSATIALTGDVGCLYMAPEMNARIRLVGTGTEPAALAVGAIRMYSKTNVQLVFDHVAVRWTNVAGATDNACERLGTGSTLRFDNGATMTVVAGYGTTFGNNPGLAFEVAGGSTYTGPTGQTISFVGASTILLDDGAYVNRTDMNMCNNGGTAPAVWTFSGAAPQLEAQAVLSCSGTNGVNLVFAPPASGFVRPAVSVTKEVAFASSTASSAPITVSVPRNAPVWRSGQKVDTVLIDAPKGINTNAMRFAKLKSPSGRFVYLPENAVRPTQLVFRYKPSGLTLVVW